MDARTHQPSPVPRDWRRASGAPTPAADQGTGDLQCGKRVTTTRVLQPKQLRARETDPGTGQHQLPQLRQGQRSEVDPVQKLVTETVLLPERCLFVCTVLAAGGQ